MYYFVCYLFIYCVIICELCVTDEVVMVEGLALSGPPI